MSRQSYMGKIKRWQSGLIVSIFAFGIIIHYQNCGGGSGGGLTFPSNPGTGTVSVDISNSASFSNSTVGFNFGDTVYQRAKNFGADAVACAEVVGTNDGYCGNGNSNMTPLSAEGSWVFNSSSGEWSSQDAASTFHGRTIKCFIRRVSDGALISKTFSVQSAADATTSLVISFYSSDAAGKNVIMGISRSSASTFYSHVKNGTTSDYSCIYVVTNSDGSAGTDNCKNSVPPAAGWSLLPVDSAADGNATMLTYSGLSSNFHVTEIQHYIYKGGQKYGPFYFNINP